eukprot:Opistho-2@86367
MGGILCCAAEQAACCVGGMACKAMCFGKCCGCKQSNGSRAGYAVILLFATITAWLMNGSFIRDKLSHSSLSFHCQKEDDGCYGTLAVYRISLALCLFHAAHAVFLYGVTSSKDSRAKLQNGFWPIKFLALAGITVGCFYIPSKSLIDYGWSAMAGAAIFIACQLLLLVDFAHYWNEKWVANHDAAEHKRWFYALTAASVTMYVSAIVMTSLLYAYFTPAHSGNVGKCGTNTAFITVNLIAFVILAFVAVNDTIQEYNPRSGLLQSSLVALYSTYLVWSAISSEPESDSFHCNSLGGTRDTQSVSTVFGVIFAFVAIVYAALGASSSEESITGKTRTTGTESALLTERGAAGRNDESDEEDSLDDERTGTQYSYTFFHTMFALAAMYMCMVITGWNVVQDSTVTGTLTVDQSWASTWVKIGSSWFVILLYLWTVIAPCVLRNREFN